MNDVLTVAWRPYPDMDDAQRIAAARAFHDAMATRRSCRAFAATPVPRAAIEWAIRAAGTAPSGANHQPWHFAVVESAAGKPQSGREPRRRSANSTPARRARNGCVRLPRSAPMRTNPIWKSRPG